MIAASAILVVLALITLIVGVFSTGLGMIYVSIASSALAALTLFVGVQRDKRKTALAGEGAGMVVPAREIFPETGVGAPALPEEFPADEAPTEVAEAPLLSGLSPVPEALPETFEPEPVSAAPRARTTTRKPAARATRTASSTRASASKPATKSTAAKAKSTSGRAPAKPAAKAASKKATPSKTASKTTTAKKVPAKAATAGAASKPAVRKTSTKRSPASKPAASKTSARSKKMPS